MFLTLLELVFFVFFILLLVTQILIPLVTGRKWFPFFSIPRVELEEEIQTAKEQQDNKKLRDGLDDIKKSLD